MSFASLRTAPSAASAMFENSQQGLTTGSVTVARWATIFLRFPKEACPGSNLARGMYFVTRGKRREQGQRELIRSNRTPLNPVLHIDHNFLLHVILSSVHSAPIRIPQGMAQKSTLVLFLLSGFASSSHQFAGGN